MSLQDKYKHNSQISAENLNKSIDNGPFYYYITYFLLHGDEEEVTLSRLDISVL